MNKCIITVVGKDNKGILAGVCTYLAENDISIQDITQTIVKGYFNMMMIVEMSEAKKSFDQIHNELEVVGQTLGVQVKCQREDIFEKMHRI